MPRPDPMPGPHASRLRKFRRAMRWMALLSMAVAAIAVILGARGSGGIHIHILIATALGIGVAVLLGTGLMVLSFLSASSGLDEQAGNTKDRE